MQVHPVRWIFIKSPIPKQPFQQVRKIYELELEHGNPEVLKTIDKQKLLEAKERTKQILIQKQRKEAIQNIVAIVILMIISILGIYLLLRI